MPDDIEQVLELVAQGQLTAAQAAPILDALASADAAQAAADDAFDSAQRDRPGSRSEGPVGPDRGPATAIRIEITERGRKVVNLRIPVSLGRMGLDRIPGLSGSDADLIRQALAEGRSGTLLQVDDEDSGVRIALE